MSLWSKKPSKLLPARTRRRIPEKAEVVAAKFLAVGYGMTFGAMFGSARRRSGNILLEGALLGLASWAAGFLGWLPATGLVPPVWKQKPKQIFMPVAEHALFGVATVAGYKFLQEKLAA